MQRTMAVHIPPERYINQELHNNFKISKQTIWSALFISSVYPDKLMMHTSICVTG